MTNLEDPEEFVADYTKLLPTSDINEMQKVLEMRGIKRSEQAVVLSIYR